MYCTKSDLLLTRPSQAIKVGTQVRCLYANDSPAEIPVRTWVLTWMQRGVSLLFAEEEEEWWTSVRAAVVQTEPQGCRNRHLISIYIWILNYYAAQFLHVRNNHLCEEPWTRAENRSSYQTTHHFFLKEGNILAGSQFSSLECIALGKNKEWELNILT